MKKSAASLHPLAAPFVLLLTAAFLTACVGDPEPNSGLTSALGGGGSEAVPAPLLPEPTSDLTSALGGDTSRAHISKNSFGLPAPLLSNLERRHFEIGDSFFTQNWVTAPASTKARDGLGPTFVAQSCSSCHSNGGRGEPPEPDGEKAKLGLALLLSVPGADPVTGSPAPIPNYGQKLQDRSIIGVPAEGRVQVSYEMVTGEYGDATPYELRKPTFEAAELAYGPFPDGAMVGARLAPQMIGLGLLEAIPTESILAAADPDDVDGDGISGRPNMVVGARNDSLVLGRFGWKANVPTLEEQVALAFFTDIGISSDLHPSENCPGIQTECASAPNGGSPELTSSRFEAVTFYVRVLSVPSMRNADDPDVRAGEELFTEFGCASCHTVTQRTGDSDIETLAHQVFHPFTDLLLHDMGEGLSDNRPHFLASGSEWRTPPLWGIGLLDEVSRGSSLLHDGRARNISEAILWHGGEAEASKEAFRLADEEERDQMLKFLEAL